MKNLTIKFKVIASFTILVILLLGSGGISYIENTKVVEINEKAMITADLTKLIKDKEIDQLIWTDKLIESILLDKDFDGQLDPHKCGFGKWYFEFTNSEEFKQLPENQKKIILDMEEPHVNLHNTASLIESERIQLVKRYY